MALVQVQHVLLLASLCRLPTVQQCPTWDCFDGLLFHASLLVWRADEENAVQLLETGSSDSRLACTDSV